MDVGKLLRGAEGGLGERKRRAMCPFGTMYRFGCLAGEKHELAEQA